jgi:hypothetical protein
MENLMKKLIYENEIKQKMDKVNITLLEYINNELYEYELEKKKDTHLKVLYIVFIENNKKKIINYIKQNYYKPYNKYTTFKFIMNLYFDEFNEFYEVLDLIPLNIMLKNEKYYYNNNLLLYFCYKKDYDNFVFINNYITPYNYFNELIFFKIMNSDIKLIKVMFSRLSHYLSENDIDEDDYKDIKENMILLNEYLNEEEEDPFFTEIDDYTELFNDIDLLIKDIKQSHIRYKTREILNESFFEEE